MAKAKKKPSLLTSKDIYTLKEIERVFEEDYGESVSQLCMQYGSLPDETLLVPVEKALYSFCKDNPKLNEEYFERWCNELTENEEVFDFDRVMSESVKEARQIFDRKMEGWTKDGLVNPDYDTDYAFWGIIGKVFYQYYNLINKKETALYDDAFFIDKMFGKYKIIALEYEDDSTLDSFQNPHGYNRFDVEAILFRTTARYEWPEIQDIYNEVKAVVYEDPHRKLKETKEKLERLAKSSSKKKFLYAFLYTTAVIEWYLKNH